MSRVFKVDYIPDPDRGRPLWNAKIFIGVANQDPTIPSNQIQLTGDIGFPVGQSIPVPQPVRTNAGGITVYNNSPLDLNAPGQEYAIQIFDRNDNLIYNFPQVDGSVVMNTTSQEEVTGLTIWPEVGEAVIGQTIPAGTDAIRYPFNGRSTLFTIKPPVAVTGTITNITINSSGVGELEVDNSDVYDLAEFNSFIAANDGDSQLAGGNIWPLSSQDSAQVGDDLTGYSRIRDVSSVKIFTWYPFVQGVISSLDFDAKTATIDGTDVTLIQLVFGQYIDASAFIDPLDGDDAIGTNQAIQLANESGLPVKHFGDLNTVTPINLFGTKGVKLDIEGFVTNSGPNSNDNAIFDLGSFGRSAQNTATYYACNDVTRGNGGIVLSNPADSSNFSAGDLVFIRWGDFFTVGGEDIYENAIACEVVSITGGTGAITLSSVIKASGTNVQITNINDVATSRAYVTCKKALGTNRAKLFKEGGGCYASRFEVDEYNGDSWCLGNAIFETTIESDTVYFDRILYEFGVNSSDNIMNYRYAELLTAGVVDKRVIRTGEQQKRNKLNGETLSMDRYTAADVPVYIEGSFNEIKPGTVYAKNAPQFFGQFVSQAFAPTQPKTEGNVFEGEVYAGSGTRYWNYTQAETLNNKLSNSEFYGAVSSSALSIDGDGTVIDNVFCEQGRVDAQATLENERVNGLDCQDSNNDLRLRARTSNRYRNNRIGKFDEAADRNLWENNITITSTDPSNNVFETTYTAGEITQYDTLSFELGGDPAGATTGKTLQIIVSGNVIMDLPYDAADTGDFNVTGKLQFSSLTSMIWRFDINSGSSIAEIAQSGGATIPDISANSLTVQFRGYKDSASDTLRVRIYRQLIDKAGY